MIDKKCVCGEIEKSRDWKMNHENVLTLAALLYIKEHMPEHEHSSMGDTEAESCELTREKADRWVKSMENADGSRGAYWTMEKTEEVRRQYGITEKPLDFWVTMNMMYSDYCKVTEKFGVNTLEFYACMAKAFLEDPDAKPGKLARYREFVAG